MHYRGQSAIHQGKEGTAMKTRHTLYALALAGWAAAFSPSHVGAMNIDHSMVLDRDLKESVVITASNVDLNCNFHRITNLANNQTGTGITVNGKFDVLIKNCIVIGWQDGIKIDNNSRGISLIGNQVTNND